MSKKTRKYYELNTEKNELTIYLYDDIMASDLFWGIDGSSKEIRELLNDNYSQVNVRINSYGGDVFEGIAIYNLLKSYPAPVNIYIDSCACSIASVIAMAGDKVYMPENTFMMIHNCWSRAIGNSNELRKAADELDKIMTASIASYMSKVNITEDELKDYLDNETWLTAKECVEIGLADEVIPIDEDNSNYYQSVILANVVAKRTNLKSSQELETNFEVKEINNFELDYDKLAKSICEHFKENSTDNHKKESAFVKAFLNEIKER